MPLKKADFAPQPDASAELALYWLGHAGAIVELGGKRLLIDPVLGNAAPMPGVSPRFSPPCIQREELPRCDYILITHNHYDHLERETIQSITEGQFVVAQGLKTILVGWGIAPERITELAWGESLEAGPLSITAETGIHYSSRASWDKNQSAWNSYVIALGPRKIFWSGDTGYGDHFREIGLKYGGFDLAAIEIDAWNPGWPRTHLFPEEVLRAAKDLGADRVLPIHWGVFDLALHPWRESIDMVEELFQKHAPDVELVTPMMGQRWYLGEGTSPWWKSIAP